MTRHTTIKSPVELDRMSRTDRLFEQIAREPEGPRRRDLINDVVVVNLPVARSIAWRFRGRGCPLEDLEQTACMALLRAAGEFDADRGHHFLTYAVPCMSGSVKKYFRDCGWTVRPPRPVQELQRRMDSETAVLEAGPGPIRPLVRLAEALGVEVNAIEEARQARGCFTPTSLDLSLGAGRSGVLGDLLVAPVDAEIEAIEARLMLRPALARLSAADRSVLGMRFVEEWTQQQMAAELGTSQPAVSRLLNRILGELHAMVSDPDDASAPAA